MESFRDWLADKEEKLVEIGTGTNAIAVFSRPIGGAFRRMWPQIIGGRIIHSKKRKSKSKKKKKMNEDNQVTNFYGSGGGTYSGKPMSGPSQPGQGGTFKPDTQMPIGKITDDELEDAVGVGRSKFSMNDYPGKHKDIFYSLLETYRKTGDNNLLYIMRLAVNGQDEEMLDWYGHREFS